MTSGHAAKTALTVLTGVVTVASIVAFFDVLADQSLEISNVVRLEAAGVSAAIALVAGLTTKGLLKDNEFTRATGRRSLR